MTVNNSGPPIHPLSSFIVIVLDGLWSLLEIGATISIAGILALLPFIMMAGISGFVAVCLVQRFVAQDDWAASVTKGLLMGIVVAIPYFIGVIVGLILLGWAGIHSLSSSKS